MAIELTNEQKQALEQALSDNVRSATCAIPPYQREVGSLRLSIRWTEGDDTIVARMGLVLSPPAWIYIPWMETTPEASEGYVALVCSNLGDWARNIGHPHAVIQSSSGTEEMFRQYGFEGTGQWLYCDVTSSDNNVENTVKGEE